MKESFQLTGKQPSFRQHRTSNSILIMILLVLVVASFFLVRSVLFTKEIKSPFEPSPTPTRPSTSYALEGETWFTAGNLEEAIKAYQQAVKDDPNNAQLWSEMARIQAYSSTTKATDEEKRNILTDAMTSIDTAKRIAPDDSTVHAIRAFVLDWNATPVLAGENSQLMYNEAEQEALQALQLDKNNTLALAYYAEILVDQQKWTQAEQNIQLAMERNEPLMDVYRVNAYVQESLGNYNEAIKQYEQAAKITPNLAFLYIYIGYNYRQLRLYQNALENFEKAVNINKQLGVSDPIPYLAIGKTYTQTGDFFSAALNVRAALKLNPTNADVYGNLGVVYFKSRNYESSILALQCAVAGCDNKVSCNVRTVDQCEDPNNPSITIVGLPLSTTTVVYYYTYASVLAGMNGPGQNPPYCSLAVPILKQIRAAFTSDESIISIIQPSEEICASAGYR